MRRILAFFLGSVLVVAALVMPPASAVVSPERLQYACAGKSGVLRYVSAPGGCSSNETLVTFNVAAPILVCVGTDGIVRRIAKAGECKKGKGTARTIPAATPAYFCVGGNLLLLSVQDPALCKDGETAYVVVNTAPSGITLSPGDIDENEPANTTVGTLGATDPDVGFGDALTFTLVTGTGSTDNSRFSITGNSLKSSEAFDHETHASLSIRVRVTDAGGLTAERQLTVTVNDVAESAAPTDIALSNATVAENQAGGTNVGALSTTDPDVGETFTYTLVTITGVPNDNGSFQISGSTLQTSGPLDHEGAGPTYAVSIQSDDGNGGSYQETFTITVTDANDPPTNIGLSPSSVDEDQPAGTTVGTLSATDQDSGQSHSFLLVAGTGDTDNASFTIDGSALKTAAVFDFETKDNYSVRLRADDGSGGTYEKVFAVAVSNGNDDPSDVTLSPSSIAENQPSGTTVGILSATDPDPGDTHTFTLVAGVGGEDNASFSISGGDTLQSAAIFDFETQDSYSIRVQADDGNGGTFTDQLTVSVTDANEGPTALSLDASAVEENAATGTAVGTLSTTDDPGDTHTYTLVAGTGDTDNASFGIDGDQLETAAVFDYETKSSYTVRMRTTDGDGASFEAAFAISVTNVNEAPTDIGLTSSSVNENEPIGTSVGTLSDTDPDAGDTAAYSLVSGAGDTDNAMFAIVGSTLQTAAPFNYEQQASRTIRIRITDSGGLIHDEVFTITIVDVNDVPVAAADSYTGVIGNTTAVLGATGSGPHVVLIGSLVTANDSDEDGDTLSVTAESVTSTGGGTVTINANGSFVYLPGVGDKAQLDTFTYQLSDGEATSPGTVTIEIGPHLAWYVDRDAASNGDGRSSQPLQNLAGVNGAGGAGDSDGAGDWVFLYASATPYTGGIPLETNQQLYGEPAGLVVDGHTLVAAAGANPVVQNGAGDAIALAEGTSVRAVNVSSASGAGISASGVNNASVGGAPGGTTTASGAAGAEISVSGGTTGGISFDTQITGTAGRAVVVTNRTGGTITFNGAVADAGTGVALTNNTGGAVTFRGGLNLNTTTSDAFTASGGGTLTVDTGQFGAGVNRINTTTGTALRVQNTTISASGLYFHSISSNGAANGIVLQNTGTLGGLQVTGTTNGSCGGVVNFANGVMASGPDLADCTGGSILNSTGAGVLASATSGLALMRMRIANGRDDGISGASLRGFFLYKSVVTDNGDAANENGIDLGDSASVTPQGAVGFVTVRQSTITGSADSNVSLRNSNPPAGFSAAVAVEESRIAGAGVQPGTQDGVQVAAFGNSVIALTVEGNSFAANKGDHVQVLSGNAGGVSGRFTSATIRHNTMAGGAAGALGQGITINASGQAPLWSGSLKYDVDGNLIAGAISHALTVDLGASGASGLMSGFVRNNTIGTTGVALSCSQQGNGLFLDAQGSGTHTVSITGNTIRRCFDRGIGLATGDGNGQLNATVTGNTVTEMADTNAITGTPRQAFIGQFGTTSTNILGGSDSHTACLVMSGNSFTGGASKDGDIRLRQRFQNRVVLPGYAGSAFDATAVQNHLMANNSGSSAVATFNDDAGATTEGYFGGAACAQPVP